MNRSLVLLAVALTLFVSACTPGSTPPPTQVVATASTPIEYPVTEYYLWPGENLGWVAQKIVQATTTEVTQTEVEEMIVRINPGLIRKTPDGLWTLINPQVGDRILIPYLPGWPTLTEQGVTPPTVEIKTYTVEEGDTLYDIAQREGIYYLEFASLCGVDPDIPLQIGQVLTWMVSTPIQFDKP